MKEPALDAFVGAIERHWAIRGGRERALSPRDFALARGWFEAGLSLATVLAGVDRAFDRAARPSSLLFCERDVLAVAPDDRRRNAPHAEEEPQSLVSRLETAQAAIERADAIGPFEKPARRIAELLDLIAVAREPNAAYIRGRLLELDQLLDAAAVEALPAGEAAQLHSEAERAIGRLTGRVDTAAIHEARQRYLRRRARERLALTPLVGD